MRTRSVTFLVLVALALGAGRASAAAVPWTDKVVEAQLDQADVRDAVTGILDRVGASYVLPDGLYGRVTAHFSGLPAHQVLSLLLEPYGWEVQAEGDAARFVARPQATPAAAAPASTPAPPVAATAAAAPASRGGAVTIGGAHLAVIRLRHADPGLLLGGASGYRLGQGSGASPFQPLGGTMGPAGFGALGYGTAPYPSAPWGGAYGAYSGANPYYVPPGYGQPGYGYIYGQPGSRGDTPGGGAPSLNRRRSVPGGSGP